ncbi:cell surface glycoprotein [Streptomyces sp. NPDC008265]|uniref:zinc finger domain-containing protein n=1 Tax=Streptomyces sp. NPDC008265 TaxID=3364824 RepID=UPI0036E58B9B
MNRTEVAALLAYAVRLDLRLTPESQADADERLDQWYELLADVPPTAPHPDGRDWNAALVVKHHIASSPYRIQPSDISRPWHTFKADTIGRHTDPVPPVNPDDAKAYRAALAGTRHAVATGQAAPAVWRELTGGSTREERDEFAAARLAAIGSRAGGTYVPRDVAEKLTPWRRTRAQRERLAAAGKPDPLNVPCPWEPCRAAAGKPCQQGSKRRTDRADPHPARVSAATVQHHAQGAAA